VRVQSLARLLPAARVCALLIQRHSQRINNGGGFVMASKKRQLRLAKLIAPTLPKGERPRAVVLAQDAVPTWGFVLMVVGFILGGLGAMVAYAIVLLTLKRFVLVLTGTSVYVIRLRKRPFRVVAVYPLGAVPVSNVVQGRMRMKFDIQLPDHAASVALRADLAFKTELGYIAAQAAPTLADVDPRAEVDPTR
jgi:hypothetical protein